MNDIVKEAEEYALSEIDKYGLPSKLNFHTSNRKAEELITKIDCHKEVVKVGVRLMDIKLGESSSKGKIQEHVELGVKATKEFLSNFNISEERENKIINCVEAHHNKKWKCVEAEICANSNCYRFLLFENWLKFYKSLDEKEGSEQDKLNYAEMKADEKWSILSLAICKKELEKLYRKIKEYIREEKK